MILLQLVDHGNNMAARPGELVNKLHFVFVFAFVMSLQACTPDTGPEVESGLDETGHAQVQNRGAGTSNWWDKLPRPEWSEYERVAVDDNWFEVYLIIDGVFAIYEPGQFEEVISFLIMATTMDSCLIPALASETCEAWSINSPTWTSSC